MQTQKVLILTAGYGEGHHAAARGLKEAFDETGGPEAEVLDPFETALGRLYPFSRRHYLRMVHESPGIWAFLYAALNRFPFLFGDAFGMFISLGDALVRMLKRERPAIVVSVFPVYGHVVRAAARRAGLDGLRSVVLITDSISVNALWYRCDVDAFLVPNEDTANVLKAAGIAPEKIAVTGFPVSPRFAHTTPARPAPGADGKPRVLFMVNGGPKRAVSLVERILREQDVQLTVTVGKENRLGDELTALAERMQKPLTVLGWVTDLPALLRQHHVVIGKAGGATVQEALAAHTPMLITQILPGQETGNARLLLQYGCGAHTPSSEAVITVLSQLFQNEAVAWHRMHKNCVQHGRPEAAAGTVRWILRQLSSPPPSRIPGIRPDNPVG